MKRIAMIASFGLLVACGQAGDDPSAAQAGDAMGADGAAVASGPKPGTYIVTAADGSQTTSVLNADGTFSGSDSDGNPIATGNWTVTDGKTCFSAEAENATPTCWTDSAPGADGSFTSVSDDGDTVTIKPAPAP